MKSLNETIQTPKERLGNPNLTAESREREETNLHYLKSLKHLLNVVSDEMVSGKKYCWRHGQYMIKNCDVCEECLTAEKLARNEEEEIE